MFKIQDFFGVSPFEKMVEHIEKVSICLDKLEQMFKLIAKDDFEELDLAISDVLRYESEADDVKDEIRRYLAKNLYTPFDKQSILSVLSAQDGIADVSEDIARLFSLRKMNIPQGLNDDYNRYVDIILITARKGVETVRELNNLFEVGFKGPEVEKVRIILSDLEKNESIADEEGINFTRKVLALEGQESPVAIYMWMRIIKVMGDLANISEKMSNRFRLFLS